VRCPIDGRGSNPGTRLRERCEREQAAVRLAIDGSRQWRAGRGRLGRTAFESVRRSRSPVRSQYRVVSAGRPKPGSSPRWVHQIRRPSSVFGGADRLGLEPRDPSPRAPRAGASRGAACDRWESAVARLGADSDALRSSRCGAAAAPCTANAASGFIRLAYSIACPKLLTPVPFPAEASPIGAVAARE